MIKMNLIRFILISFFSVPSLIAQDYLTKITNESCECLSNIDESEDRDKFNMELGLCIIDASIPYKKELKRDHNIDLDNIIKDGTRLGELIGIKMAGSCPNQILRMTESADLEDYDDGSSYASGTITKIEKEQFIVFTLKDENGRSMKFHWLYYVDSEIDLPSEYSNLVGKKVGVYYYEDDLFDARIDEYKLFNVIEEINLIK